MKYVAEIPVRLASKRVPLKNLRMIDGKPMVAYAIEACKGSKYLDEIYINSESETLKKLSDEYDVKFYARKPELAFDHITQDEFNYDFICNTDAENLVLVNPVSPLLESKDIDDAISHYEKNRLDTLISVREVKLQSFYRNNPINISIDKKLPMTQHISPIQLCAWTVCIWNTRKFKNFYEEHGYAVFVGILGYTQSIQFAL
jgi:CMP-N,N'-diacetyllegionaminic acid synthase